MSGIGGMVTAGAPVNRAVLSEMLSTLRRRGPDRDATWIAPSGDVSLLHTMLITDAFAVCDEQPLDLAGRYCVTGDMRLDGRQELIAQLYGSDRPQRAPTDAELVLRAYVTWGDDCPASLLGDFCFAIWDVARSRLFCARDHLGVKPFFYAAAADVLTFSNTLLAMPSAHRDTARLSDGFIADFLLFGYNRQQDSTVWADIRRLPAGHSLTWDRGRLHIQRFWSIEEPEPIRYRRPGEYIDHFRDELQRAVAERTRAPTTAAFSAGGLDSNAVLATLQELRRDGRCNTAVKAFSVVWDSLIPDQERRFATLAASALGVPIDFIAADNSVFRADHRAVAPEPSGAFTFSHNLEIFTRAAGWSRNALTGQGGDEGLHPTSVLDLIRLRQQLGRPWVAELLGGLAYLLHTGSPRPPLGLGLKARWNKRGAQPPQLPTWIAPDFADRCRLGERLHDAITERARSLHGASPLERLRNSPIAEALEFYDPGTTGVPLVVRHPLLDLRLLRFLLTIPPIPWGVDKRLLRDLLNTRLPPAVTRRPKTPLAASPLAAFLRQSRSAWIDDFEAHPALARYVLRGNVPRLSGAFYRGWGVWRDLGPFLLNGWLGAPHVSSPQREHDCAEERVS